MLYFEFVTMEAVFFTPVGSFFSQNLILNLEASMK